VPYPTSTYEKSLYNDISNMKPINVLIPHQGLSSAALFHAKDMGYNGTLGHKSSDNTECHDRVRKIAKLNHFHIAECCNYGNDKAIEIVFSLLVDENTPSLGHRNILKSNSFNYIGVSIQNHKTYGRNTVIDMI